MAPVRPKSGKASKSGPSSKSSSKGGTKLSKSRTSSSKGKKQTHKPAPVAQKSKRPDKTQPKKKRTYTEKELGIEPLNGIVPAGVRKPRGAKKGKIFLDDPAGMLIMLNMVIADKEGSIESKMTRARQMEEIRQARRVKLEKDAESRKAKFERVKDEIHSSEKARSGRKGSGGARHGQEENLSKRRVSFA